MYDLGCGDGGVTRCAQSLGFECVGVDIELYPNYPAKFIQADVRSLPDLPPADIVWCSPDCQGYSRMTALKPESAKPKLVSEFRRAAKSLARHYVIENVSGCHDLRLDLRLCGGMFGLPFIRWRWFEVSFLVPQPVSWYKPLPGMSRKALTQAVPWAYTCYILSWFKASRE